MHLNKQLKREVYKRALSQKELREIQSILGHAEKVARVGSYSHNLKTESFIWSDEQYRIFGYSPGEVTPTFKRYCEHIHPDDREKFIIFNQALIKENRPYDFEHKIIKKNGQVCSVRSWASLNKNTRNINNTKEDKIVVGLLQDISKQKLAEENINMAIILANKASHAKSEFLSSMSHELRTPLNSVLGFAQLLQLNQDKTLNKGHLESVEQVLIGGRHLLDLINDLLDMLRIESGKLSLTVKDTLLEPIINLCIDMVQPQMAKNAIKIHKTGDFNNVAICIDPIRFKQMILNLLSNAIKYNRENGLITINCKVCHFNMVRISIIDNGIGISPHHYQEVFKPFARLGAERTRIEGTGIGLSVVKKLAQLMNGSIGFNSEKNKGSTFWLELPLGKSSANISVKQQSNTSLPKIKGSVLYIEDSLSSIDLVKGVISNIDGLELFIKENAPDGIKLAKDKLPNLIIMDINLPGMNGYEALEILKADTATKGIPVIAMSSAASAENINRGLQSGFKNYLTKPIDVIETVDLIKKYIEVKPVEV